VTIARGIGTVDGIRYDAPFSFSFSTRPSTTLQDPTSDPTPHTGEPWVAPPEAPNGTAVDGGEGCSASGGAGLASAVAVLLVAAWAGRGSGRRWYGRCRASCK